MLIKLSLSGELPPLLESNKEGPPILYGLRLAYSHDTPLITAFNITLTIIFTLIIVTSVGKESKSDEFSGTTGPLIVTPISSDAASRFASPLVVNAYALRPTSTVGPPTIHLMVSYLWAAVRPTSPQTIRIPMLFGNPPSFLLITLPPSLFITLPPLLFSLHVYTYV